MFTKDELRYLLEAVQRMQISNTAEGRNKAAMMLRICNELDQPDPEPENEKKGSKKESGKDK